MGLFKRCRAKRAAKKKLKEQSQEKKHEEVILKEEKVIIKKEEPLKETVKVDIKKEEKPVKRAPEALEEQEEDKEEKTTREIKPRYHVSQNKNKNNPNFKRWGVKLSSSTKTIKYHDTQAEAIKHAEQLAKSNDTTFVIHKLDGKIRKQNY